MSSLCLCAAMTYMQQCCFLIIESLFITWNIEMKCLLKTTWDINYGNNCIVDQNTMLHLNNDVSWDNLKSFLKNV